MGVLVAAATDMEMQAFLNAGGAQKEIYCLITGIGPVETTLSLTKALQQHAEISCVLNFGIAGAYLENDSSVQARLLDLCLAEEEILGDLGIQLANKVQRFRDDLPVQDSFVLDADLLASAGGMLREAGISSLQGVFVTVNCASGTLLRGNQLGRQFRGLCENMEGAAVARVCAEFSLPCLEVRCISNMVEDRNRDNWRIQEACAKAGRAAAVFVAGYVGESGRSV